MEMRAAEGSDQTCEASYDYTNLRGRQKVSCIHTSILRPWHAESIGPQPHSGRFRVVGVQLRATRLAPYDLEPTVANV